jgi:hypothetical protein
MYENNVAIGSLDVYTYAFNPSLLDGVRVLIYTDNSDRDLKYVTNDGSGWSSPTLLYEGTFGVISAETAYNFEYQSGRVNYAFLDGTDIYYDYIYFGQQTSGSVHAFIEGTNQIVRSLHAYLNSGTVSSSTVHAYIKGDFSLLVPNTDVARVGVWQNELAQTTNIYQSIDELSIPDDSDYILESPPVNNDYYECGLTDPIGPVASGTVSMRFRGRNNTSGSIAARIQLRQGGSTVIASRDQVLPTDPTTYSFDLTSGEKAAITDPTDLRLRFIVLR